MNIEKELEKMKKYLEDNIKIRHIEITDYCLGGKHLTFHTFEMIDDKKTRLDYSFHIEHYEIPSKNYANAEYLLHIGKDHKTGGSGYAIAYNSIEDFKNDDYVKKLIGNNEETEKIETIEGQMSLFDEDYTTIEEIQFNFDDLDSEIDPVEELLSYGIDKYYSEMLKYRGTMTIREIEEELSKLPKYKEYMDKFGNYLRSILPTTTYEELGSDFNKKCLIETDSIGYRINGNRMQFTAYCLQQYMTNIENKSLF